MKVKLQCVYGDNLPGDVIDIKDKELAKQLIADGLALDTKEAPTGDTKELKAEIVKLQAQVEAKDGEIEMLKAELEGLKNGQADSAE